MKNFFVYKKSVPLSLIWVMATAVLCGVFILVLVPSAEAQGREARGTTTTQYTSQYTSIIQDVFDFIQRHYVDEVEAQTIYGGHVRYV